MTLNLTHDSATQVWDQLAKRLDQFIAAWDAGELPALESFLPAEPPVLRRMVLVELVKIDLEQRAPRGLMRRLEQYAADHPELLDNGEPPCDLIYEEYHVRRSAGEDVAPREYFERFPRSSEALKRLLGTEDISATTQLHGQKRADVFRAGERVDDFDLLIELGKGAFATVFLARQISLQRLVALKVSADKGNEPQTLAKLDHPHIVRVYDQRSLPDHKVRVLYMQFAPGGTLQEVVHRLRDTPLNVRSGAVLAKTVGESVEKTGTAMSDDSPSRRRLVASTWPDTVCRLGIQLAQALDYAHREGVLHRDVKPANILLSAEGAPKLADFNISFCSKLEGASPAAYFGGSLAYMSPEQLEACNPQHQRQAEDLDGRSDLFSLAVVLWELLHGERPFRDEALHEGWSATLEDMTRRRQSTSPGRPSNASRDALTQRIEIVLLRALSPDPEQRYADGAALARELSLCLNPGAWELFKSTSHGWQAFMRRHPLLALVPLNLTPFIIAAIFNWIFNYDEIISKQSDEVQQQFFQLSFYINGTLFPIGTLLIILFLLPIGRAVKLIQHGQTPPPALYAEARRRVFWLGHVIALIGVVCWVVAGAVFPIGLHFKSPGEFPPWAFLHFILSQTLCGLVSAGFPFIASTWVAVRVFFPTLLGMGTPSDQERRQLAALPRHAYVSLGSAAVVPMFALFLVAFVGMQNRLASTIFIAAGVLGFIVAAIIFGRIRRDVNALTMAIRPAESFGTVTDSVEAY